MQLAGVATMHDDDRGTLSLCAAFACFLCCLRFLPEARKVPPIMVLAALRKQRRSGVASGLMGVPVLASEMFAINQKGFDCARGECLTQVRFKMKGKSPLSRFIQIAASAAFSESAAGWAAWGALRGSGRRKTTRSSAGKRQK